LVGYEKDASYLHVARYSPAFLALANDYAIKEKTGNYNVEVRIDKNPPGRGSNNMGIYLKDGALKPVTDAHVQV
jgi:hypothetical protein